MKSRWCRIWRVELEAKSWTSIPIWRRIPIAVLFGDTIESIKELDIFSQTFRARVPSWRCFHRMNAATRRWILKRDWKPTSIDWEARTHGWPNTSVWNKTRLTGIHWQKLFSRRWIYLARFSRTRSKVIVGDSEGLVKAVDKTWDARGKVFRRAWVGTFRQYSEELFLSAADLPRV